MQYIVLVLGEIVQLGQFIHSFAADGDVQNIVGLLLRVGVVLGGFGSDVYFFDLVGDLVHSPKGVLDALHLGGIDNDNVAIRVEVGMYCKDGQHLRPVACPCMTVLVVVGDGGFAALRVGGYDVIDGCAETVTEKPMFRRSIAFQRCVIPATGFYEWDAAKHKYFFQMPGQPIYLAGIYDTINGVNCFIILTTEPNDSVAPIHDRMPLLLSHEQVRPWLVDAGAALELLCSRPPLLLRTSCDGQLGFDDLA